MSSKRTHGEARQQMLAHLVGHKIPRLWCPPLTHYTTEGTLDTPRIATHWTVMRPNVQAFLVPGSTGDGWEMTDEEIQILLDFVLELAQKLDVFLLIGVLKTHVAAMHDTIIRTMAMLKQRTSLDDPVQILKHSRVCGFTVCPPAGADLTREQMQTALESVLELGVPIAIYQLPQITKNEMSPELIQYLAERYANFILLKDSSGQDRVALADQGKSGIFLVRGAEGNYTEWLQESGGPYHGLLLSTANCFSAQLKQMIVDLETGRIDRAKTISDRLTQVVKAVFALVSNLPYGNPFTNANKAIDHFMAYGLKAERIEPPRLHAGTRLPGELIKQVGKILREADLVPQRGYVEGT
jgi:dihydrodipicolinate synthase/N-acetylneuraminate lyase